MKKHLLIITLVFIGIITISSTMKEYHPTYSTQPPAGNTGTSGVYCNSCHGGPANPVNSGGGMVSAAGLPTAYSPGVQYNFSITISHGAANREKWGFSIQARNSANQPIGSFSTTNPNAAVNGSTNELSHLNAVSTVPQSSFTYTNLAWTAPSLTVPADQNVTFYIVGNAANRDNGTNGDFIYASTTLIVLPVKISKFDATLIKNTAALTWTTESESNTAYFGIEKSTNGVQFFEVGRVIAAGFSNTPINYSYTDATPGAGGELIYYRIVSKDLDGKQSVSEVRLIRPGRRSGDFIVTLGPNPVQRAELLNISYYSEVAGALEVNIYSLTGKQVIKEIRKASGGLNSFKLNVNKLAAGQYAAEFVLNGKKELRKIIVK